MSAITVSITGHLADTPELRLTPNGKAVTNFVVIGNDRRRDQETGEWVDAATTSIRITAWGRLAENLVGSIGVGHNVTVVGSRLTASPYAHRESGEPRASLELTADSVKLEFDHQTATVAKAPKVAA